VRLATQVSETVTITGKMGAPDQLVVDGTVALKFMYAAPLPPALQASGHGPVSFTVRLRSNAPLASISVGPPAPAGAPAAAPLPAGSPVPVQPPPAGAVAPFFYSVPVTLPARAAGAAGNPPLDVAVVSYKAAPSFAPAIVRAQATGRATYAPAAGAPAGSGDGAGSGGEAGGQQQLAHRFTDVVLKTMLHPSMTAPVGQAQLLVQLPAVAPPAAYDAASAPMYRPTGAWSAARAQLLWALVDAEPPAGVDAAADAAVPRVRTYLAPGKAAELKARVPVSGAPPVSAAEAAPLQAAAAQVLPLQLRFTILAGSLTGVAADASAPASGGAAAPPSTDAKQAAFTEDAVSGHRLAVGVGGVVARAQTAVRARYMP
jgi:hypothetical protein